VPTFTVANANRGSTGTVLGPFVLPQKTAGTRFVRIALTSSGWTTNAGRPLIVTIEQSLDGGLNWRFLSEDTFRKNVFAKDGSMPSITFGFNDLEVLGQRIAMARSFRITMRAPGGTVNAGCVGTF
jgi:hypothetical protein